LNNIYGDSLYNPEIKKRFLSEFRENTRKNYEGKLKRASRVEMRLGKDLYDFTLSEFEEVIYLLAPTKLSSAMNYGSILRKYVEWASGHGLRKDKMNPLASMKGKSDFEKFVPQQTLIRKDHLDDALSELDSYRDIAIILSIFEGILGRNSSEIRTLKVGNIDKVNNKIKLTNVDRYETTEREIIVSDFLIDALLAADQEEVYKSNFGEGSKRKDTSKLKDSDYIIKSTRGEEVKQSLITFVITKFGEKLNRPSLSPIDIRNSGMLEMARKEYLRENKKTLDRSDIHKICKQFNVGLRDGGIINSTMYTQDFLNEETIKRVYPELE
jgi:hypothetical protein